MYKYIPDSNDGDYDVAKPQNHFIYSLAQNILNQYWRIK